MTDQETKLHLAINELMSAHNGLDAAIRCLDAAQTHIIQAGLPQGGYASWKVPMTLTLVAADAQRGAERAVEALTVLRKEAQLAQERRKTPEPIPAPLESPGAAQREKHEY